MYRLAAWSQIQISMKSLNLEYLMQLIGLATNGRRNICLTKLEFQLNLSISKMMLEVAY